VTRDDKILKLSAEPDGFGFFYGWAYRNGKPVHVDVLPPRELWRGQMSISEQKPDPKAWIIYMNGEEFARVERREDIARVIGGPDPQVPVVQSRNRLLRWLGL
jgi:hypothetical protein